MDDSSCTKQLVLVGDDFGFSKGVTDGCIEALQNGILTEMSFMVGAPASQYTVKKVKDLKLEKHVGIHITLNVMEESGKYLKKSDYDDMLNSYLEIELSKLVRKELTIFEDVFGQPPTHINSHKNVHQHRKIRETVANYAKEYNIFVRRTDDFNDPNIVAGNSIDANAFFENTGVKLTDNIFEFIAGTYDEAKTGLLNKLSTVKENTITEIFFHPAYVDDILKQYSSLLEERGRDRKLLQDDTFINAIKSLGFSISTFSDISR